MATAKQLVRINDTILLCSSEEEEDGYASSADERRVVVRVARDLDCIFKILPLTQYVAQEQFSATKDATGASLEALYLENERNELLTAQMAGRDLLYGQIIQFVHKRTGKFLAAREQESTAVPDPTAPPARQPSSAVIAEKPSTQQTDNSWLRLEKTGSKRCWFKIMPAQKGKLEGQKVSASDKVLLFNIVHQSYLRQCRSLDESGNYEVDLQEDVHSATLWKLAHSDVGGARHRTVLKQGDSMRLFHENAGYLHGSGDLSSVKCKYYHSGQNETVTSYKSLWVVESEASAASSDAEQQVPAIEVGWGRPIKLRLYGTNQYLCTRAVSAAVDFNSVSDEARVNPAASAATLGDSLQLVLTSDVRDPNTVFCFTTAQQESESDAIAFGTTTFIHSVNKDWLHVSDDALGYTTEAKGYTDSEVLATKKFSASDAFAIKMIPKFQKDDFDFCEKRRNPMKTYLENATGDLAAASQTPESIREITTYLSELIKYCTISDNDKPLEREGQPILAHQKLLAKVEVVDIIVAIAKIGTKQAVEVTQLAFRLLKQVSKRNPKNGLHIFRKLPLDVVASAAIKNIDYYKKVPIAEMYFEIYQDNNELLYSVTAQQIANIFTILTKLRDYHYVELLSVLCRYKGSVIHTNQKKICMQLAATTDIIFKTKISKGLVEVSASGQDHELCQFVYQHKDRNEVKLFFSILVLYSDLCEDRNSYCIHVISGQLGLTFNICFTALKTPHLESNFRAVYCKLLLNVFSEFHPQYPETTAFKKVWYRAVKKDSKLTGTDDEDAGTNAVYTLVVSDTELTEKDFKFANPANIQELLIDYIFDKYNFRFDSKQVTSGQPQLLLQIMRFTKASFFHGQSLKRRELPLMPRFRNILDIDPDKDHEGYKRRLPEDVKAIIVEIKQEVLTIVERFFDIQDNTYMAEEIRKISKAPTEDKVKLQMQQALAGTYKETDLTTKDPFDLAPVLLRLLKHENAVLTSRALSLLKRLMLRGSKSAVLMKLLPTIQILTKTQDKETHQKFEQKIAILKEITSSKMVAKNVETVMEILDDLITACLDSSSHSVHQRMFLHMGAHTDILNMIRRPLESDDEESAQRILIKCYSFLREFCHNSKDNQKEMFDHIEFMTNQLIQYRDTEDVPDAIMQTICALFKDNASLCRRVTEKIVLPFVNIIFEQKRHSTYVYMDFFKTIIKPGGFIIKANQNIVLKLLVAVKATKDMITTLRQAILRATEEEDMAFSESAIATVAAVADARTEHAEPLPETRARALSRAPAKGSASTSPGDTKKKKKGKDKAPVEKLKSAASAAAPSDAAARRGALLRAGTMTLRPLDMTAEQILEENRAGVVGLLALCSEERNYFTEVTCQKLISIDDCLNACHQVAYAKSANASAFKVMEAFLHFADEVYLNTESSSAATLPAVALLPFNPILWNIIAYFVRELKDLVELGKNSGVPEEYELYIFRVVLPFLQHFFAKFQLIKANHEHKAISSGLLDSLHNLRTGPYKGKREELYITNLMKVLVETGITSTAGVTSASLPKITLTGGFSTIDSSELVVPHKSVLSSEQLFYRAMSGVVYRRIIDLLLAEEGGAGSAANAAATPDASDTPQGGRSRRKKSHASTGSAPTKPTEAKLTAATEGHSFVDLIVTQIRNATVTRDDRLTRTCLKLVKKLIKAAKTIDDRRLVQATLAELDTPLHLIRLMRSNNIKVAAASMSALRVLLDEGLGTQKPSKKVLDNISHAFSSGGHQQFFEDVMAMIQAAKLYLKDQKRKTQKRAPGMILIQRSSTTDLETKDGGRRKTIDPMDGVELEVVINADHDDGGLAGVVNLVRPDTIDPGRVIRDVYISLYLLAQGYPLFKTQVTEIVTETVQFLKVFESIINPINIDLATQIFISLKELTRQALPNQQTLLAAQAIIPINRILNSWVTRDENKGKVRKELNDDEFYEKTFDLKIAILDFLHTMIEDTTEQQVITDVINSLNFYACTLNTAILQHLQKLSSNQHKKAILLASSTFRLVKVLSTKDTTRNTDLISNLAECEANCASRIGTVEVLNNKDLAPIYFPIPTAFRPAQENETAFIREVNRSETDLVKKLEEDFLDRDLNWGKSAEKVDAYIDWVERVLLQREFREGIRGVSVAYYWFLRSWQVWWQVSFLLAIVVNILILTYATAGRNDKDSENYFGAVPQIRVIGLIQTVTSALMMITILLKRGILHNRLAWKKDGPRNVPYALWSWDEIKSAVTGNSAWKYFWGSFKHFASDSIIVFSILYFAFSILGNAVSPFFFAAHMFQIVVRSAYLKFAVRALVKNVVTLFFLLVLLFNGVYVFAILSFNFFTDIYDFAHDEGLPGSFCDSVWNCMMVNLYYGVPVAGGLVQFLPAYDSKVDDKRGWWLFYQILFFFFVGPIVFNILLATIVDTFGDLREKAKEARDELGNACLICSIDRDAFQQKSKNFNLHLEKDHNRLHYLYFFAYLKERRSRQEMTQLSILEKTIFDKINDGRALEIFPIGRALALEDDATFENAVDNILERGFYE